MSAGTIERASRWLGGILPGEDVALIALVGVGLLLLVSLLVSLLLVARRRTRHEVRELVIAIEELRAGRFRQRPEIAAHSALGSVGDAIGRLGQDLQVRLGEAAEATGRLEAVMEALQHAAVITTDLDGDIRSVSEGAASLLGWGREEAVTRPVSMLFAEGAFEALLPRLTRRTERERGVQVRTELRRRDGTSFPAELTVRTLHRPGLEASGFVLVAQDVSETVRMEREARESEARYRSLVEGLSIGAAIVRGGRILYASPAFAAPCGVAAEGLVGQPLRDRLATGDVLLLEDRLASLEARTGATATLHCTVLGPDGRPSADVRLELVAIDYAGGPAVLALVHDETTARRVEAELRHNESRLDAVLEAASDGILVVADEPAGGLVRMTNRALLDLLGLEPAAVLGRPAAALVVDLRQRGGGHAALAALLAAPVGERRSELLRLGGAEPREIEVTAVPLVDDGGRIRGRIVACRDLTAQRESERRLEQRADEVQLGKVMLEQAYRRLDAAHREAQARSAELDRLNEELRKLDEMKSNLLGNVSHELQTPLVSIRGYTEIMLKEKLGPLTAEQRKGLGLCLKNIDRLIAMIDGLVSVSRPDAETDRLRLTRFALREVVDEAAALLREELAAKGLHFEVGLGDEPLVIHADRDRIVQVLVNLLSNAVKFTGPGGRIDLRAHAAGAGFARVEVADTGIGIPGEALERIFERHYRVEPAEPGGTPGRGLGLSIVRDILRRHGCRIDVESEIGRGTRFTFTLPLVPAAERGTPTGRPPAVPLADGPVPGGAGPVGDGGPGAALARPRFRIIRRRGEP